MLKNQLLKTKKYINYVDIDLMQAVCENMIIRSQFEEIIYG